MSPDSPMPDARAAADTRVVRIGARRSPLAVAQAHWVGEQLRALGVGVEFVGITSQGDVDTRRLTEIGGTGVFAAAVREALHDGRIDIAVHSLKDLPVAPAAGLVLAALPPREDARDVLVGLAPEQWSDHTVIGTGSPRRELQLRALAEGLGVHPTFVPVRGNVDTRIALVRSGSVDATVLAAAGLRRLGHLGDDVPTTGVHLRDGAIEVAGVPARVLGYDEVLPAAGQGALGIECRDDAWCLDLVARLDDADTRAAVQAERQFLATLEAGCLAPIGAHAIVNQGASGADQLAGVLELRIVTASTVTPDGSPVSAGTIRDSQAGEPARAAEVGDQLARRVLQRLQPVPDPGAGPDDGGSPR